MDITYLLLSYYHSTGPWRLFSISLLYVVKDLWNKKARYISYAWTCVDRFTGLSAIRFTFLFYVTLRPMKSSTNNVQAGCPSYSFLFFVTRRPLPVYFSLKKWSPRDGEYKGNHQSPVIFHPHYSYFYLLLVDGGWLVHDWWLTVYRFLILENKIWKPVIYFFLFLITKFYFSRIIRICYLFLHFFTNYEWR